MANQLTPMSHEAATLRSLIGTITNLSQVAEDRGDRASASILLNVAALLAEVNCNHPLLPATTPARPSRISIAA